MKIIKQESSWYPALSNIFLEISFERNENSLKIQKNKFTDCCKTPRYLKLLDCSIKFWFNVRAWLLWLSGKLSLTPRLDWVVSDSPVSHTIGVRQAAQVMPGSMPQRCSGSAGGQGRGGCAAPVSPTAGLLSNDSSHWPTCRQLGYIEHSQVFEICHLWLIQSLKHN